MPPPRHQIYFRHRMSLTFDLLTAKVDRFMPSPRGPLVPASKSLHSFSKYRVHNFGNGRTVGRTQGHSKGRVKNIMSWRRHRNF